MKNKVVLKESPLLIALAAIRYTEIPEFDNLNVDSIFTGLVKLGFKHKKLLIDSTLDLSTPMLQSHVELSTISPASVAVNQKQVSRHVFISLDKKWSVHLTREHFILKTSGYETFENFSIRFNEILNVLIKSIPFLSDVGCLSIGLRYADLILPKKGYELGRYLNPKFEQPDWNQMLGATGASRSRLTSMVTTSVGNLRVDLTELFPGPNGECEIIPPDLGDSPDTALNLSVRDWWIDSLQSRTHYAILDIDHSKELAESFALQSILEHLKSLYQPAKQAFLAVVSEEAQIEWQRDTLEQE